MLSQKTPPPLLRIARNPTVDLTVSIDTILKDLDFVIVTHTHSDHFDTLASEKLPKRHQIILPTCRQRIYGKANFVNAEVKKQKQPLKILPHKNRRKTRKWRNIGTDGRGFWIRIASRKRTDFIYCWRQHLWKSRKCNHNF
jgi:hypothetical protein